MSDKPTHEQLEHRVKELERELTDCRTMIESRSEDEERYRAILEGIEDSYLEVDLQGNFRFFNDAFCRLLGCSREELLGADNRQFLDQANAEKVFRIFAGVFKTRTSATSVDWEFIRKDGTRRTIDASVSLILNQEGHPIGFRGIGRDVTALRRAQKELSLNEARFRDISLSMADWIWEVDKDGKYVFAAGNLKKVLGYEPSEILGKTPFDFMPESEAMRVGEIFSKFAAKKEPIFDLKNWNVKKDGSRVCLLTSALPIMDEQGQIIGYRGIDKDITSNLIAEDKLMKSTEMTEKIIENLPIGMVIVWKNKTIQRINRAGLAIAGRDSDEGIIGRPCYETLCPADEGKCPILDLGQSVNCSEKMLIHRDGRHIPVYKTALPITIGGEEVILEAFMDIRELKETQSALHESTERLHTVMDTIADPLVVYDPQGRVTYVNPAFSHVFGWTSEEVMGHRIDFVPDELVNETQMAINKILDGERLTGYETQRYTKDGQRIDVGLGAALLRDTTGRSTGIVVNFQDITRQKQAREQLKATNQELEEAIERANAMAVQADVANAAKSEFLANMSHEIRTPMNAVIGMTDLLMDTPLTAEQKVYLGTIKRSGYALLDLINNILDLSKIESGNLELENIDFLLQNAVEGAVESLAIKAEERGIELATHIHPDVPPYLMGDPGKLRQMIINLVGNALKFTETGEIVVRSQVNKRRGKNVKLHFMVSDTGIGIPEEKQELIFQSFQQGDGSVTRKHGGTGLGLSITKRLAEMMGGRIWVNSTAGKGSTFHFLATFGISELKEIPDWTLVQFDFEDKQVLIVDDNATNRHILREMVASWGFLHTEAADGKAGLITLNQMAEAGTSVDLLLLDGNMPEMHGFEVAERVRADQRFSSTRIILLTSAGQRGDAARCREIGISAYLIKPVRKSVLYGTITRVLSDQAGEEPLDAGELVTRHTLREKPPALTLRILLAEDDPTNQKVAVNMLRKQGHGVTVADNGESALKLAREKPFDLILMDVQMPVMDGLTATKAIREQEKEGRMPTNHIPIIAMTAHALKGDREVCLEAGMDDYFTKPVKMDVLDRMLKKWGKDERSAAAKPVIGDETEIYQFSVPTQEAPIGLRDALEMAMGDREFLKGLLQEFINDMPAQLNTLHADVEKKDFEALKQDAHRLKGSSRTITAKAMADVAYALEMMGRNRTLDGAEFALKRLGAEMDRMKTYVEGVDWEVIDAR